MNPTRGLRLSGFTLIELVVTLAIIAMIATMAAPMSEVIVQRNKEQELRTGLRQVREAIDAYKQAYDEGHITKVSGASGYPPSLDVLVDGVQDAKSPEERYIYFLRRLPRDPFAQDELQAMDSWGLRSYASSAKDPQQGDDVFDVYSLSEGVGLNGVPYKEW